MRVYTETDWKELGRLDGLESYARGCLELACPEYVLDVAEIDLKVRQAHGHREEK